MVTSHTLTGRRFAQPLLPIACVLVTTILGGACIAATAPRDGYLGVVQPDAWPPRVAGTEAGDDLWGRVAESRRGDGIAEAVRPELEALVRRFTPTLVLPKADHVTVDGRRYQLTPTEAGLVTDTLRIDLFQAAPYEYRDSADVSIQQLDLDSLVALTNDLLRHESDPSELAVSYFDWPNSTVNGWWEKYAARRTGPDSSLWAQPTVYAHPFLDEQSRVVIQYWFFYPFNDHIGNHEGDWEHINVVLNSDRSAVEEVHYYFHVRSVKLPQGEYQPEIVDGTHPISYAGGRLYNILDFPIRLLGREHNEGAHGNYPYAGEWEGAGGLGAPESAQKADRDSARVVRHDQFRVVLMPEPSRFDYSNHPEILREWWWLLVPVRWGFPAAASVGSELKMDVGNRGPFGPAFNPAWNRSAPGLHYPAYTVRKIGFVRSLVEDLLQPWYYLYIFRTPRFVDDARASGRTRRELERLGLVPLGGSGERGIGSPIFGLQLGIPQREFSSFYNSSTGISLWRNFWVKLRFGVWRSLAFEVLGGYQKFVRDRGPNNLLPKGSLFAYPITGNIVLRAPDALFRPYVSAGAGAYGWSSQLRDPTSGAQFLSSGWDLGVNGGIGIEYYLRPRVAFDVGVRYHWARAPGSPVSARGTGIGVDDLRFLTIWLGHYVRF